MPRNNSTRGGDELVLMGNYVPTNRTEHSSEFTVDPSTFPRSEVDPATQNRNVAASENEQRLLINREIGGNAVGGPSGQPQSNSPFQENSNLNEDNISTSELLKKTVVHIDRLMENLPELTLPELKLIGCRVSFNAETRVGRETTMMKYVGNVGTINKDTVLLLHVFRFKVNDDGPHVMQPDQVLDGIYPKRSVGAGLTSAGMETFTWSLESSDREATPPLGDGNDSAKRIYGKLLGQSVGMGPIPFVTFSRTSINHVNFVQDPPRAVFSLFRDPARRNFDMQCLRMFCRRYIVHTVQKNNPNQIPLRAFIACRCNCTNIDERLLTKVAREEIVHLVNIERAAKRAKKKAASISRSAMSEYIPPSIAFGRTGVLFLTQVPQRTFTIGVVVILFSLLLFIFFTFCASYSTRFVIAPYIRQCRASVYTGGSLCLAAGALSVVHSFFMTIFSSVSVKISVVRFLLSFFSLGSCFVMVIVVARNLQPKTFDNYICHTVELHDLYAYYDLKGCEGYRFPCTSDFNQSAECRNFCNVKNTTRPACADFMLSEYTLVFNLLLCISIFLLLLVFFEIYTHFKLLYVTRLLLSYSNLT